MTAAEDVVDRIRAIATDEHDKGDRFERLMLHAFRTDRTYAQQFTHVWRWMDWPERGGADIGVDLVARNTDGTLTAIQCKCYAPTTTLSKEEIDSFVALSGQKQWARRIILATTDLWSLNAENSLVGHAVPIERMGLDDLDAMTVDWSSYHVANPAGLAPTARHELRPHQVEAVDAVRTGFESADRGKLMRACGTGKTFTAVTYRPFHQRWAETGRRRNGRVFQLQRLYPPDSVNLAIGCSDRTAFAADLKKSLPRIPQVATADDFWAFSRSGRELARLHTEYEAVEPWPALTYTYAEGFDAAHPDAYRVLKMKHPKIVDPRDPTGRKIDDRSRIIDNDWITIGDIPERAYAYELGSRSAIAWVIESNRVLTDKASGIRNDPNDRAIEHDDPTYILDLVGRVVTVSMQNLDLVDSLPNLDL